VTAHTDHAVSGHGGASLLSVRSLVVRYGDPAAPLRAITAVRGVRLDIEPGNKHALVGE